MHGVSGAVGLDVAEYLFPEEREVADKVEYFVAHKFVGITQRRILYSIGGQHNTTFTRSSADQSHVQHRPLLVEKAEGARRRNLFHIAAVGKLDFETFVADQGMGEVDGVTNGVSFRRIHADELVA